MLEPGLRSLLHPVDLWTFFSGVFGRRHLTFEHPASALDHLVEDLGGLDLRGLLEGPRRPEINLSCQDRAQWFSTASTDEALDAYAEGFTAYFHVGQLRPPMLPWIDAIAEAMGVPFDAVDVSVFASPPGSETPLHYDAAQNLTLQLAGKKRWRVAANTQVGFPRDNWALGQEPGEDWRPGAVAPAHADLETVDLAPGRGLYLPGGHWHTVQALEHSLAITYSVNVTRGLDLALDVLARHLGAQEGLRRPRLLGGLPDPIDLPAELRAKTLAAASAGLQPSLWAALGRAPTPIPRAALEVAIVASELDPDALTEHAWVTLWVARDAFEWSDDAGARLEELLRARRE